MWRKWIYLTILLGAIILPGCIEPFDPEIDSQVKKIIVVDGNLSNLPGDCRVELKYLDPYANGKTFGRDIQPVGSAIVLIRDSEGNTVSFNETSPGVYLPVDDTYHGVTGQTYQLTIDLPDGRHYESDAVVMPEQVPVDSIYAIYEQKTVTSANNTELNISGMQVYIDTRPADNGNHYFQYDYVETWKQENWGSFWYRTWLVQYNSGAYPQSAFPKWPYDTLLPDYCYRRFHPKRYLRIATATPANKEGIRHLPVELVSLATPRLSVRYSIQVKQSAITYNAYEYWRNVEQQSEYTGSFYDPLPSRIYSNIYNPEDNSDVVAGFFFVRNTSTKRLFISREELPEYPDYTSSCIDYNIWAATPWGTATRKGWPDLFNDNSPICFDCRLSPDMTDTVPDFWRE